jgi:flagellar capping protein FliD
MNRVDQITSEIKQLEKNINLLKKELENLQKNCKHEFKKQEYIQVCTKCHLIESLYW